MAHLRRRDRASPLDNGTKRLSLIGKGRYSTTIAIAAPTIASKGVTKIAPPTNAHKKPAIEPSRLLSLLKGNGVFEKTLPKIDAALSPKAKIATAA
jgi:hypothetical protein